MLDQPPVKMTHDSDLSTFCLYQNLCQKVLILGMSGLNQVLMFGPDQDAAADAEKGDSHRHKSRFWTAHSYCREFLDYIESCVSCK